MQLENRNIVKCILLTFITCGIYGIVWGVKLARDAVRVKDVKDDGLVEILLVLFLPFVGFFLAERKLNEGCQACGIEHKDNSILYLVLGILGLGIVVGLGLVYILAFRINNRGRKSTGGCGGGDGALFAIMTNSAIALVWFALKKKH